MLFPEGDKIRLGFHTCLGSKRPMLCLVDISLRPSAFMLRIIYISHWETSTCNGHMFGVVSNHVQSNKTRISYCNGHI